jgi:hypothetical protein
MESVQPGRDAAFTFAQDLVKQVITLSAGIVTVTITFFKDFVGTGAPHGAKILMAISWMFYVLAVVFGIWTMMALTGSLGKGQMSIYSWNVRWPTAIHLVCFILGLGLTIGAGWWAL